MTGMKPVPINVDKNGSIDLGDLEAKCKKYGNRISAMMVTYPSTYGIFEDKIK